MSKLNLRQAREKAGVSVEFVAEQMGVSVELVKSWEAGERSPEMAQGFSLSMLDGMGLEALFEDEAMVEEKKVQFIQEHIKKIYVSKNSDVFIVLDNVAGAFLFIDKEDTRIEVVPVAEYNPEELSEEGITENDFVPFDRESMPLNHGRICYERFSKKSEPGVILLHRLCRNQ